MTTKTWQLQEAKQKLSEVVRCAEDNDEPQFISVHGDEAVVVLSAEEYAPREEPLQETQQPGETLYHWFKRTGIMQPIGDELCDILNADRTPNDMVPNTSIFDQ
jgi:prevent-host-death family protein